MTQLVKRADWRKLHFEPSDPFMRKASSGAAGASETDVESGPAEDVPLSPRAIPARGPAPALYRNRSSRFGLTRWHVSCSDSAVRILTSRGARRHRFQARRPERNRVSGAIFPRAPQRRIHAAADCLQRLRRFSAPQPLRCSETSHAGAKMNTSHRFSGRTPLWFNICRKITCHSGGWGSSGHGRTRDLNRVS